MKITERAGVGQGTFYLYFASKKDIFDELVRDLNRRVRLAMKKASSQGGRRGSRRSSSDSARTSASRRSTRALPDSPPGRVRVPGDARTTTTSKLAEGYIEGLREAVARGEIGDIDPEVRRVGADGRSAR